MSSMKSLIIISLLAGLAAPVLATDVAAQRAAKKAAGAYDVDFAPVVLPGRDALCDAAEVLVNGSAVNGTNVGGVNYVGWSSPDVFYQVVITEYSQLTLTTCNSPDPFDAYLRLYQGCPTDGGMIVGESDDSCGMMPSLTKPLAPGIYFVVMEGFNNNEGTWLLEVSTQPWDNPCASGVVEEITFTNGGFHGSFDLMEGAPLFDLTSNAKGFVFTLEEDASFLMTTCFEGTAYVDSDSWLYAGNACDGNTELIAYIDGDEFCEYSEYATYMDFGCGSYDMGEYGNGILPGGTYSLVFADYYGENGGTIEFDIQVGNCNGNPGGTVCEDAEIITNGSSVLGFVDPDGTNYVGGDSPDVFYQLLVPAEADVTLSTCATVEPFDAYLRLYAGCPLDGDLLLMGAGSGCTENPLMPVISTHLSAGTYFVVVEGIGGEWGNFQLDVTMDGFVDPVDPCDGYTPSEMVFENGHFHAMFDLADGVNVYDGEELETAYTFTLAAPSSFYMDACRPGTVGTDSDSFLLTGTCGDFTALSYVDGRSDCPYAAWPTFQDFGCGNSELLPAGTYTLLFNDFGGGNTGTVEFDAYIGTCGESVGADEQPLAFRLGNPTPNPFNPSTTIAYSVSQTGPASLKVHDLAGRLVATLVDGMVEAGGHSVVFDGSQLASGVYFTTLQANGQVQSQKMVLVK